VSGGRRLLLLVALAAIAVVPLRAFGVVGDETAGGLSVSASLGGCGVGGSQILCEIQVDFGGVEGADYYTASVTRADGSVQNAGTVGAGEGGGSASIYVPYVGSGTYTVTVSAWGGGEDGADEPELLERDRAGAGEDRNGGKASSKPTEPAPEDGESADIAPEETATEPPPEETPEPAPEIETLPECQPEAADAATAEATAEGPEAQTSAAPPAQAPAPSVECTEPSSDANGPCCPPGA
jgi:hypothetical protein